MEQTLLSPQTPEPEISRRSAMTLLTATAAIAAASSTLLQGCVPLAIGSGAAGVAIVAADRRTTGMQLEDERIEQAFQRRVRESLPTAGRLIATSFNRIVLLTGEVRSAQEKEQAGELIKSIDNVRAVINEIQVVAMVSTLTQRSKDTFITSKVKASLVDARDLQANTIKVVTEQQIVYLMGMVTPRESKRAAEIARGVNDVLKVVRVFEEISEEELAQMRPAQQTSEEGL